MLQNFENEIRINIFRFIKSPRDLALTCRTWSAVIKDPYAKSEWLITQFGKAHALFHAVRLGPTFIDVKVCETLIDKVILSRIFIQRILPRFGGYDIKLLEQKVANNVNLNPDELIFYQNHHGQKTKFSWARDLPFDVFKYLTDEGYRLVKEIPISGVDDMESFCSSVPMNLNNVEDLILNKRFIPFPPRPKELDSQSNSEEYPSKDGYENTRQLKVIARAISIRLDLVNLWKKIGYHEICNDFNDVVMQDALCDLFPRTPASGWTCPSLDIVTTRLSEFVNIGFTLEDNVIVDAFHMFDESRLNEIGRRLWDAFLTIRSDKIGDLRTRAFEFFKEAFNPKRNLKKGDFLKFFKSKFDLHGVCVEQVTRQVVKHYFIEEKMSDITLRRKSLILSPTVYRYILATFDNSNLASICFEDILILRIYIDSEQADPRINDSIVSMFNLYVKNNISFEPKYLNSLQKVASMEIITPLLDNYLSSVFGMNPTYNLFKGFSPNNPQREHLTKRFLEKIAQIGSLDQGELSVNFRESFTKFCKRLEEETHYRIREEVMISEE